MPWWCSVRACSSRSHSEHQRRRLIDRAVMHMVAVFWALAGVSGYQNTLLYQELYMTLPFEHVERMSQLLGVSQQVRAASSLKRLCEQSTDSRGATLVLAGGSLVWGAGHLLVRVHSHQLAGSLGGPCCCKYMWTASTVTRRAGSPH